MVTAVLPGECRVCGCALVRASLSPVCGECVGAVRPQTGALCGRCGEALPVESARFAEGFVAAECGPCRLVPPEFERAVAFAEYDAALRALVWLLKYERVKPVAGILGEMLAEAVLGLREGADLTHRGGETAMNGAPGVRGGGVEFPSEELVVVAVPLFAAKERRRGFNQSEEMARAALRVLGRRAPEWRLRYVAGVMERVRQTEGQFTLDVRARRRNLKGAFRVRDTAAVAGREVLLVDDIYTTGATARECARVLRKAGAVRVWVATAARAQRPQVSLWDGGIGESVGFGSSEAGPSLRSG